jgi:hypothetical protein
MYSGMEDLLSAGGLIRNRVDRREGIRLRSYRRWQRIWRIAGCFCSCRRHTLNLFRTAGFRSNHSSPIRHRHQTSIVSSISGYSDRMQDIRGVQASLFSYAVLLLGTLTRCLGSVHRPSLLYRHLQNSAENHDECRGGCENFQLLSQGIEIITPYISR